MSHAAAEWLTGAPTNHEIDWDGRIAAHVGVVEQVLRRQVSALDRSWADDVTDAGSSFGLDLPVLLRELLDRGGKRTRPVMTFLGWVAGAGHERQVGYADVVRAAAAVEMLHVFALVHDDVMDESPLRRGRPTVHEDAARRHAVAQGKGRSERFGESIAVLVGDLAHAEADAMAVTLPEVMRRIWQRLVRELVAGQFSDLTGAASGERGVAFARAVARQKTGNYTVARPLQLGAAAAGAGTEALESLAQFGRHAGEAFALRDDILGVYGDPHTTGKPAGDDLRSGKSTVLLAVAADTLRGPEADALAAAGSSAMTDAEVATLQRAMREQGVVAAVENMIGERVADALAALNTEALSPDGIAQLTRVLDSLARRGR